MIIFLLQCMLISDKHEDGGIPIMPRGNHRYHFQFKLPESALPSSFESKIGTIRYYIRMTMDIPYSSSPQGIKYFTIVGPHIDCMDDKYLVIRIYTVRQKLSTTWLISIISFLIMNLFQIGLLFSLPVYTYVLTCETGYRSIFIYVYMTWRVKCHVYFSTFVFANESWFLFV